MKALYYRTTQLSVSIDHALAWVTLYRQAADYLVPVCPYQMPAGQAPGCLHPPSACSERSPVQLHPQELTGGSRDPQPVSNTNSRCQGLPPRYNRSLCQVDSGLGLMLPTLNAHALLPGSSPGSTALLRCRPTPDSAHSPWAISHPRLCLSYPKIPTRKRAARPTTNSGMWNAAPQPKGADNCPHFALKPKPLLVTT